MKYAALYNHCWVEVDSDSSYHAQVEAAKQFRLNPSHAYKVFVTLVNSCISTTDIG